MKLKNVVVVVFTLIALLSTACTEGYSSTSSVSTSSGSSQPAESSSSQQWIVDQTKFVRNCATAKQANLSDGQVAKICSVDRNWSSGEAGLLAVGAVAEAANPVPGDLLVVGGIVAAGKVTKLIVVQAVVVAPAAAIALEPLTPEITQALGLQQPFDPTSYDGVAFSRQHAESPAVEAMAAALAASVGGEKILQNRGDGPSQGSIKVYAGLTGNTVSFAALINQTPQNGVKFVVVNAPAKLATRSPGQGWRTIPGLDGGPLTVDGQRVYYNAIEALVKCSWTLTKEPGRDMKSPDQFLNWGQSMAAWRRIQRRYNLVWQIAEMPLPL